MGATFPLVTLKALLKENSDHCPLLVDSSNILILGNNRFRFEKWWLEREDFKVVQKAWDTPCHETDPMSIWQFRIRTFIRLTRGWASNIVAEQNKLKQMIVEEYNKLDLESEVRSLSELEVNRMNQIAKELDRLWALEEIKLGKDLGIERF